jgi:HD-GYP domain-containing protein (c-di-GMP phosphodiesterase class II)
MQFVTDSVTFKKEKLAQPIVDEPKKLPSLSKIAIPKKVETIRTRLDLLNKICHNTRSVKDQVAVYSVILQMARNALNASASSMILFDEQNNGPTYRFSDGPLGKQVIKLTSREQIGIANMAIQSGKTLKVNAIDEDPRFGRFKGEIAGVLVRSAICVPLKINKKVIGVIEVLNRLDGNDFNDLDLATMDGMASGTVLTIENVKRNESLLNNCRIQLVKLVKANDARELSECKHARRVVDYALIAARELSLSAEEQQIIEYGATLHDIGMISVPPEILQKKEKLTNEDWNTIRKHPVMGYNLLRGIPSLDNVGKIILYHHERFDGKGYPSGLKGESIPLNAQIISVAEAFDSMTVKHAYREAMDPQQAMKELGQFSGTQFNPDAVKALCMGHIRSRSLNGIKAKQENKKIDYFKNQHNESSTWKINFSQSSRVGGQPPAPPVPIK